MSVEHEIAEVVSVEGQYAFLKTDNNNACGECSSKSSCGSMKLFEPRKNDNYNIRVANALDLNVGDKVILELSASKLIQGTLLIYLLPLFSLFLFAGVGKMLSGEIVSIFAGVSGLFIALFFVKRITSNNIVSNQFVPKVTRKIFNIDHSDDI